MSAFDHDSIPWPGFGAGPVIISMKRMIDSPSVAAGIGRSRGGRTPPWRIDISDMGKEWCRFRLFPFDQGAGGRRMKTMVTGLVVVAGLLAAPATVRAQGSGPAKSGHVEANGLNYYYEIHGKGEPLLLLHGGLGSIDMFGPVLPALAKTRQVVAVDLHGHGR